MTMELFPHDQQANDRLLIEAERYKHDLIDSAVRRFAPHLSGKPDTQVIHLYSTNSTLRKLIRDMFKSAKTIVVEHCGAGKDRIGVNQVQYEGVFLPLPDRADLVVTKTNLNSKTEWLAARLGGMVVVLPEAEDYLRARLKKQGVLVLVGAEQGK